MNDLLDSLFEERDLLDEVELDTEDKIIFSSEMAKRIREEVRKEIAKMPIGKIVASLVSKQTDNRTKREDVLKTTISKEIMQTKSDLEKELVRLKTDLQDNIDRLKKKFDGLRTELANQPAYQFGGFSPQANDLNIGDPAIEGAWRIVKSGTNLSMQRFESGIWTEKGSFTP